MTFQPNLRFGSFVLDRTNQQLRRDSKEIPLPPKTFAVLQYLVENQQRLVTQEELLKAVWGSVVVGDGLLRSYIRDIRHVLGDDAVHPRFIETIPRRGFRFLAEVSADSTSQHNLKPDQPISTILSPKLVGRDQDLTILRGSLQTMLGGKRQVVFIVGEAGIGKTALLNAFLDPAHVTPSILIASGQCVEQYGTREAYLPIFEALGTLCRGIHASEVIGVLSGHAPSWLAQMPGVLSDNQFQTLQKITQGTTQPRMLREFCEALEALAINRPIVLALEDLQWSDHSTLDLLSIIARRPEPARVMLIGSYRPADVIVSGHPLRRVAQDLQAHRLCIELWPDYLSQTAVMEYLADRFPDNRFPPRLCQLIHRNTGGNPLFVTAMVDDLSQDEFIHKDSGHWQFKGDGGEIGAWRSGSLRQAIEGQLARLSPTEQRVLEAAAIVGIEFAADLAAAALDTDAAEVEDCCDELVRRRQVLRSATAHSSPDIPGSSRYAFAHDMYRAVALDRSPLNQRRRWYQRIAEKITADSRGRVDEVATELAYYFEHANMPLEAAYYCAVAGDRAIRRFANSEAIDHFRRGIDLLRKAPAERHDALELRLQVGLALPLTEMQGYATDEVAAVLSRARDLNQKLGDGPQTFGALRGLYQLLMGRGDYQATLDLCDRLDRVAEREHDPAFVVEVLRMRGISTFFLGRLADAEHALKQSLTSNHGERSSFQISEIAENPETSTKSILALVLWMLGYPDRALKLGRETVATARKIAIPYSMAIAHCFLALLMRFLRDPAATLEQADSAIAICEAQGFTLWRAQASLERGWAAAMQGRVAAGIKELQAALAPYATVGATGSIAKLADVCLHAKKTGQGLRAVDDALRLVRDHDERTWEAELYRLRGELLVQRANARSRNSKKPERDVKEAEQCFAAAIARARASGSKSFELRAAMSLYRVSRQKDKRNEARRILAEVYDWFTEGFSTPDLADARSLLRNR